jgi:hypothetical protein
VDTAKRDPPSTHLKKEARWTDREFESHDMRECKYHVVVISKKGARCVVWNSCVGIFDRWLGIQKDGLIEERRTLDTRPCAYDSGDTTEVCGGTRRLGIRTYANYIFIINTSIFELTCHRESCRPRMSALHKARILTE